MKRLHLIRHAKSSWKFPELADHDRPLNARGERAALIMSKWLAQKDEGLDCIYTSTAVRAITFAKLLSEHTSSPLQADESLYTFSWRALLARVRGLPETDCRVAIVGHNPALTELVNQLVSQLVSSRISNVPTAGVVAIDFAVSQWRAIDCSLRQAQLAYMGTPKTVMDSSIEDG